MSKKTKTVTVDDISVSSLDEEKTQYLFVNTALVGYLKIVGDNRYLCVFKDWAERGHINVITDADFKGKCPVCGGFMQYFKDDYVCRDCGNKVCEKHKRPLVLTGSGERCPDCCSDEGLKLADGIHESIDNR